MKAFLLGVVVFVSLALGVPAAAQAQTIDNDLPDLCNRTPLLCLIFRAGYQPTKFCPEVIGQFSLHPAGHQCESDAREVRARPEPPMREPPKDCHTYEKKR